MTQTNNSSLPKKQNQNNRTALQSGKFIGREFELGCLKKHLHQAFQGQGRLVLIGGATGIGKTRLVHELREHARSQNAWVCEGASREHISAPYHPWISILNQIVSHEDFCAFETLQKYSLPLTKLLPNLSQHVTLPSNGSAHEPLDKQCLMEAVTNLLLDCDQPLLLIIEDLHYANAETVELLEHVGVHAIQSNLMLCGLYRDHDISPTHPLNTIISTAHLVEQAQNLQTQPGTQKTHLRLRLNPLSPADIAELAQVTLNQSHPAADPPRKLITQLNAHTHGNPLHSVSLIRNLIQERILEYGAGKWQLDSEALDSLASDLQSITKRLLKHIAEQPELLNLLEWASIIGQWLDVETLMAVCGLSMEAVFQLVDAALAQHILVQYRRAGHLVYHFDGTHIHHAIYNTLTAADRKLRHLQIGETLALLYAENEIAEALTWHFEKGDNLRLALRYAQLCARKACEMYANASAICYYGHALRLLHQQPDLENTQLEYDLLSGREECYHRVGNRKAQIADLEHMAQVAAAMKDAPHQIEVITRKVMLATQLGNHAEALQDAETALGLSRQIKDRKLEAGSLTALGDVNYRLGNLENAHEYHIQALGLYRELNERTGEADNLRLLGRIAYRVGKYTQVREYSQQALALYRDLRNRSGEADVLNALGVISADRAQARDYYEHSLSIAQAIGDLSGQGRAYNNLALIYWYLGLYNKARNYLEQAVQIERDMQGRSRLAHYLESLGRVYIELGNYAAAKEALQEGLALAQGVGDRWSQSVYWLGLGRVALAQNALEQARDHIQTACDMQRDIGAIGDLANSLAWLGLTYLAMGEWDLADQNSAEGIRHLEAAGGAGDYIPQDVWWIRYQILKSKNSSDTEDRLDDETWNCLKKAQEEMLVGIASLSDEGLRRNYLNKVKTNKDIITEWTRYAAQRTDGTELKGKPPTEQGDHDALGKSQRFQDRMKRMLDISRQMNEKHQAASIISYIMDQVTELTGAERGFLMLVDKTNDLVVRGTQGITPAEIEKITVQSGVSILEEVTRSKMPLLIQGSLAANHTGQAQNAPDLVRRSVICAPLLSRAKLKGIIYADNPAISGQFSQADVDLLTLFANQAVTALDNARLYQETIAWAQTMEQRVEERTSELQQANAALSRRAAQLEISNQVGQQLTQLLDLGPLLEQIVGLIQARFDYYFVGVWLVKKTAENQNSRIVLNAGVARGRDQLHVQDFAISMQADNPVAAVARNGEKCLVKDMCMIPPDGAKKPPPQTCGELVLPLRVGEAIIGVLDIQSDRAKAFHNEDQLVLQTLANQISISIRNAQLYETESRRRSLAESLEKAGRELVGDLDMSKIPVLILDQLITVVPYERCSIMLAQGNELRIVAQRGFPEDQHAKEVRVEIREDDIYNEIVLSQRPLVLRDVTQINGWRFIEGLRVNKSWLGVPLISKNEVIGMISITRPEVADFSEDDALLASAFAAQAAIALQNAQLYAELTKAYETLEILDKTKSNFIEVTAHELRTPLTVIKGFAQILQTLPALNNDAQATPLIDGILSGMGRMHEIVNSILDATKIDNQTLTVNKHPIRMLDLVARAGAQFESALLQRKLTLTMLDLETLPLINADSDQLFKVFAHLIVNAIKYTPDGGTITVQSYLSPDQNMVEIVISDTGIGIDPEHQELIFEKFYQTGEAAVHSSGRTKYKGGGPGLGLAIARGIVEAHNGTIWVESPYYDESACPGSHFHVRLPLS